MMMMMMMMIHWQERELHELLSVPVQMLESVQETSRGLRVPHPQPFLLHNRPSRIGRGCPRHVTIFGSPRTLPDRSRFPDPPERLLVAAVLPREALDELPEVFHVSLDDLGGDHVDYPYLRLGFRCVVGVSAHARC